MSNADTLARKADGVAILRLAGLGAGYDRRFLAALLHEGKPQPQQVEYQIEDGKTYMSRNKVILAGVGSCQIMED